MKHIFPNSCITQFKRHGKVSLYIFSMIGAVLGLTAQASGADKPYFCGDANPVEAQSPVSVVQALYGVVSGKAGEPKNWQLLKELHAPTASLTPVLHHGTVLDIQYLSVADFVSLNKSIFAEINFFETEVEHKVIEVGHMATVLSRYESRDEIGAAPYSTGINSFQLVNDGRRWCVVSVTWDSDKGGHVMPPLK